MEATAVQKTHPLVIAAAVSVTALSLAGIGAIFGLVPVGGVKPAATISAPLAEAQPAQAFAPVPAAAPVIARAEPATTLSLPAGSSVRIDTPSAKPKHADVPARAAPAPVRTEAVRVERPAPPSGVTRVANDDLPSVYAERPARPEAEVRPPVAAAPVCHDCGTVADVREVKKTGEANGIGAVAGGLLGGVVGNQVGGGRGRDAMTVIGALGGAVAGHQIEKSQRSTTTYEVTVRLDDGSTQVIPQPSAPTLHQGERVRVSGGQISAI